MKLSVVMPCLNELRTLPTCILRAKELIEKNNIDGEILISDNGSTDGSQEIAAKFRARVVHCPTRATVRHYNAELSTRKASMSSWGQRRQLPL